MRHPLSVPPWLQAYQQGPCRHASARVKPCSKRFWSGSQPRICQKPDRAGAPDCRVRYRAGVRADGGSRWPLTRQAPHGKPVPGGSPS